MKASDARGTKIKDLTPDELAALSVRAYGLACDIAKSQAALKAAYDAVVALGLDPAEVMEAQPVRAREE
jgi:hypothetical protein